MNWLKPLLGMTIALGMLGAAEGALRLLDLPERGIYRGDPSRLWWLAGELDQELAHPSSSGTFRVRTTPEGFRGGGPPESGDWWLALGCSTTFGWGVEEEETWVSLLSEALGRPVINGGVPGWSTEQAREGLARWGQHRPSKILLSYGVRDAQAAARADRDAPVTPWWFQLQLARLLRGGLTPQSAARATAGGQPRVSPERYAENLASILERWPEAEWLLFPFPQRESLPEWDEQLQALGGLERITLPAEAYFEEDPIHLTPAGHRLLAESLSASLGSAPSPPPPE